MKGDARAAEAEAGRLHEPHLHGGESGGMVSLDPAIEAVEDTLHGLVQEHEVERILRLAASTPDGRKALIGLVEDCGGAA